MNNKACTSVDSVATGNNCCWQTSPGVSQTFGIRRFKKQVAQNQTSGRGGNFRSGHHCCGILESDPNRYLANASVELQMALLSSDQPFLA